MKKTQGGRPPVRELKRFGLILGGLIACFFGLLGPWLAERPYPLWPWATAAALVAWALLLPATLYPVYRAWMALGAVLGWINTRIILTVVFFAIILPIGLIVRLLGRDPMARKPGPLLTTYRIPSRPRTAVSMKEPF